MFYVNLLIALNSEVFVIVSLTLFLPICLEQFARDNGYLLPDRTQRCAAVVKLGTGSGAARCVVKIGWAWIDSASFRYEKLSSVLYSILKDVSLYVYSASVALQALTVISMGGIADHPPHRKRLLLSFAMLGAIAATTFLILPSTSPLWILAAPLAICANVGFGASTVAMNAYLPTLARESPEARLILTEIEEAALPAGPDETSDHVDSPLIQRDSTAKVDSLKTHYDAELSRLTSRISSFGIALGYGAGIFLLIIALIPVTLLHGSTFALRLSIGLSGVWWAVFSIPAAIWLPGAETGEEALSGEWSTRREILAAWKRLGNMLRWREIKKLRNTFKYLAAWFLLSDGFTTITSTAILFGKTTLNMQPSALILVGVLTPSSGILGSLAWPYLQRRYQWTNLKVIVILVLMASAIPAYGCLGFLSVFHGDTTPFGGLTTQGEMFALAVYFGEDCPSRCYEATNLIYAPSQVLYMVPFKVTLEPFMQNSCHPVKKPVGMASSLSPTSSFIGPLIVGLIADTTGNIRYAFFFLVVMIWLAIPILASVDVERGRKDAREYRYSAT
ncbi:hypothetical protein H0H87_008510 [Tephrocybe sp. NHM501043]|nr:hypothetical protein H0H87_008510 [Tephrocybe sp. NHM501043]